MLRTILSFVLALYALPVSAQSIRDIEFPVQGAYRFTNDFNADRSGGARDHEGVDIIADKMTPAVSAIDGWVRWITDTEASWGWAVTLEDRDDYTYHYLHLNNDTPGTDDHAGGRQFAIAPGIERGAPVTRGQLIGWVGDSGNAESTVSHLHFEIRMPGGAAISPYLSLVEASKAGRFVPAEETAAATDISTDKGIVASDMGACAGRTLVRSVSSASVYYCATNGKRYVFPNQKTYATWYADFAGVQKLTDAEIASMPLGGNATYRPGVKLVKITTDPKVYAVAAGGVLRHVTTAEIATALYGASWYKNVDDVPDAFFVNYRIGEPITHAE